MKIVWTEPAVDDLAAIRDYIARDSEQYAGQFIARIIYRLADRGVEILSIIHGSRDLTQWSPKPWEVE